MTFSSAVASYYSEVISGRRKTVDASMARAALAVPAYCIWVPLSALDRFWKRHGPVRPSRPGCPVISIGNITAGGTGKTPMTEWLCRLLKALGRRPAVLTHSYRAAGDRMNDETRLLTGRCAGIPVLSGKNRAGLAKQALSGGLCDCVVLDDGFQHLAVERDLDVVLIDCLRPFGYGHPLPRGLLREPLSALRRANAVVLTRSDQVESREKKLIRDRIRQVKKELPCAEAVHEPVELTDTASGCTLPPEAADGLRGMLLSAIGNPESFQYSLERLGVDVLSHVTFRDHHRYTGPELKSISLKAARAGCDAVLTTEKDYIKIEGRWPGKPPLYVLSVAFRVTGGEEILAGMVERAVSRNTGV